MLLLRGPRFFQSLGKLLEDEPGKQEEATLRVSVSSVVLLATGVSAHCHLACLSQSCSITARLESGVQGRTAGGTATIKLLTPPSHQTIMT